MFKVGLTGGIGSGKSTVSKMLMEKGMTIIDADFIARDVLDKYPDLKEAIKKIFGDHFFDYYGNLKRKYLGDYVFKYPSERKKLENILIPAIKKEINEYFKAYEEKGVGVCILDAPTLIENGLHEEMDMNILVWVDKNKQIERIKQRDNMDKESIINRINSQMSLDSKKELVNFIVDNSKSIESTRLQVDEILSILNVYK
ncbi:dephospho-CoA kinase [Clostridium sp. 19966]|uniref:dephospho-CoA kinase n=1 Tax=Clostridium sp. 19966 TaxID=2768166 RepID=UPI0028DFEDA5|nr:dephospho-CoA kinase [Clostridium sp. 19966]MDT8715262.1 dephospho-CoA kinase [Clostridium sp. 19966]